MLNEISTQAIPAFMRKNSDEFERTTGGAVGPIG